LGDDELTPAQEGALVNRSGYNYVLNQLRDSAELEALRRKAEEQGGLSLADANRYANLSTLYPLMRIGVAGPIGQLGIAARDASPEDALAAIGMVPIGRPVAAINKAKIAVEEAKALARMAENAVGPVLEGKAVGTILAAQQRNKYAELIGLFDKSKTSDSLTVAGNRLTATPVGSPGGSNVHGTVKVFDSQMLTDQQIRSYAQQLAGDVPLTRVAPDVYAAKLADGTVINLRSISSSGNETAARWTIDIIGKPGISGSGGVV